MSDIASKDERISIRTPTELKTMLVAAAAASNTSMTDFLLKAGRKAAEKVLKESHQIQLNPQEWNRFMELLDTPPEPNESLKKAMRLHQHTQS